MTVRKQRNPKTKRASPAGDTFDMSGDFRGAVIHIKSTIVGEQEARDIEDLPPEPGDPPFQGLQYYDEDDADRFFGREMLTARIAGRLHRARFLAVIGASGSGKSSLVRAGVIPAISRGELLADGGQPPPNSSKWSIQVMTPGAHPLASLAALLALKDAPVSAITTLEAELTASPETILPAARRLLAQSGSPHLFLVIDQFEEIFTLCRSDEEREAFIGALLSASDLDDDQPVTVLVVMRADFYAQVAQHDRLREIVSQYQEFIGAMTRDELVNAIDKPLAQGNWKVQRGLIEVILDDVGYEPGALPLLSHALHETWRRRRGRTLTLSAYTDSGGIRGAIAQTAESVFQKQLSPDQQPIARMIFIRMAELGEDAHDTRRRVNFSELITRSTDERIILAVIQILSDARLVISDTVKPGNTQVFEVAHEALIREWPTLRGWLEEDRDGLILHQHLAEDTHDWVKSGGDPGILYRGGRLNQALEWSRSHADLVSLDENRFLEASEALAQEEAEKARKLARAGRVQRVSAGFILLLLVLLGFLAYRSYVIREPAVMDRFFNIAIAGFGGAAPGVGAEGSAESRLLAEAEDLVFTELDEQLGDNPNVLIWRDSPALAQRGVRIGAVEGVDPNSRNASALEITQRLNADMLIYASLDEDSGKPGMQLQFYLPPRPDYNYEDLLGMFQLGQPFAFEELASTNEDLRRRAAGLSWIALGLTEDQLGHSLEALEAFLSAGEQLPESALVQFFTGREYLFLVDREAVLEAARDEFETQAERSFEQALNLEPGFMRAQIGLGGLYFKLAQHNFTLWRHAEANGSANSQLLDTALEQLDKSLQAYHTALEDNTEDLSFGIPLASVARLGIGNSLRLEGVVRYFQGDSTAALDLFDQSVQLVVEAQRSFEEAGQVRYLAQAYEYLGTAYQWQGHVLEAGQKFDVSLDAYRQSVDYYDRCISLAGSSQDRIIRNEIADKVCAPNREEVQRIIESYSGEQG